MKIRCVWEHNGNDSILYADNFIGAFTRGASKDSAIQKMPSEIKSYLLWKGGIVSDSLEPEIVHCMSNIFVVSPDISTFLILFYNNMEYKTITFDKTLQNLLQFFSPKTLTFYNFHKSPSHHPHI